MNEKINAELTRLIPLLSPEKLALLQSVVSNRTRYATVILEDLFQPHNASAALRSCEVLGVQNVHVVEKRNQFTPVNDISMGAGKWLTVDHYENISDCCAQLKNQGYVIAATTLTQKSISLYDLPLDRPVAMLFGSERKGISAQAEQEADIFVTIPMYGFTQSFNISVAVSLCIQHLINQFRTQNINWQLSQEEQDALLLTWIKRVLGIIR